MPRKGIRIKLTNYATPIVIMQNVANKNIWSNFFRY